VGVILAVVFALLSDHLAEHWQTHLPAAVLLCALMLALSWAVAAAARLDRALRFTVAVEASIHNVPIVVLLADQLLARPELASLAVVYVPVIAVMAVGWSVAERFRRPTGSPSRA
ncbi:hypothetical protein, partial [Salmonella enterica]|uniref:hypothetical protein n=1 Tax=Salmonella enterica TaxID=28901 RepID=UPI003FA682DD